MGVCEAMNQYFSRLDWAIYYLFFFLGTWKLYGLSEKGVAWVHRKVLGGK